MNATQKDQAERVSRRARISYIAATQILSAERQNNYRQLAIHIENYLVNGEQSETLKNMGLTIFDCLVGDYEWYNKPEVEGLIDDWNARLGEQVIKSIPVGV